MSSPSSDSSSMETEEKRESSSSATTDVEQDDDDVCPICLCLPNVATVGPCGHELCVSCMERILLAKRPPSTNHDNSNDPDAHLSAPTLGRCPICRSELCLFDLKQSNGNSPLVEKDHNIDKSPIAGLCYAQRGQVGCFSYHFPAENQLNNKKDSHGRSLPYLSLESGSPCRKYFEEGCHFYSKSRTFHGRLVWSKDDNDEFMWKGFRVWEVVMQFSSDLRYVSGGTLVKRRDPPPENIAHPWPLDGRWEVKWERGAPDETAFIDVVGGEFCLGPFEYTLDTSDVRAPKFTWPMTSHLGDTATLQTAVSGVDLEAHPEGPPVGAIVVWTTTDPEYTKIVWVRQTIGGPPPHRVEVFGPGRGNLLYQRVQTGATRSASLPKYDAHNLWGNTFVQALKVGLASYHFLSSETEEAYISYEHPLCAQWPSLDDGSPVPSRVAFRGIEFNPAERVFQGKIEWQQEFGTTWQGAKKWIYEIRFDSEFTCVLSGKVSSIVQDDQVQEMSCFGDDLIYINAGILDKFNHLLSPDTTEEPDGSTDTQQPLSPRYDRYRTVSQQLRRRLESEGASVRTMATIQRVLVLTQQPDAPVVDFNL